MPSPSYRHQDHSTSRLALSASGFGCGNDLVEARVTAQRIPAGIEAQIAVGWGSPWHLRDNFELLQRTVALGRPRVNQRQVGDKIRTGDRVLGKGHEFDRAPRLADRVFLLAKPSIKRRGPPELLFILRFGAPV